jgi:tetratricopeptide (TPR) repeat protein
LTAAGWVYERNGRLADAEAQYVAALAKDPTYLPARASLGRVIEVAENRVRAEAFMAPAAAWLSLMLFEAEWRRRDDFGEGGSLAEEQARIHNYIGNGLTNLSTAPGVQAVAMLRQAIAGFSLAQVAMPAWFVPWKNGADAVSYLGVLTNNRRLQSRAIALYDTALERLAADGLLSDQDPASVPKADLVTEIRIDRAISRLLAGEIESAQEELSAAVGPDWDPETEPNADILYAVACYGSRVVERAPALAEDAIGTYVLALIYAFVRDRDLVEESATDPDLDRFRPAIDAIESALDSGLDGSRLTADVAHRLASLAIESLFVGG